MTYISHEEAYKGADPWNRVRLQLKKHEANIAANGLGQAWDTRNMLYAEIAAYLKSERHRSCCAECGLSLGFRADYCNKCKVEAK